MPAIYETYNIDESSLFAVAVATAGPFVASRRAMVGQLGAQT